MDALLDTLGTFGGWLQANGATSVRLVQHPIDQHITSMPILARTAASIDEIRDWGAARSASLQKKLVCLSGCGA